MGLAQQTDCSAANAGHDINHVQHHARVALELDVAHADGDHNAATRDAQEDLDVKLQGYMTATAAQRWLSFGMSEG